jgi:hypothetical protein
MNRKESSQMVQKSMEYFAQVRRFSTFVHNYIYKYSIQPNRKRSFS